MVVSKPKLLLNIFFSALWLYTCFGGLCDLIPVLETVRPFQRLACDLTMMLLGLYTLRHRGDLWFLILFTFGSYIITCHLNSESGARFFNGWRYFIPLLFSIPFFRYFLFDPDRKAMLVEAFDRYITVFLYLQIPASLIQFALFGAHDAVGGTMGFWYSGVLTTLIYMFLFYRMSQRFKIGVGYLQNIWNNKSQFLFLIPTMVNETKVGFIFLMLFFVLLIPINRKIFLRLPIVLAILPLMVLLLAQVYFMATGGSYEIFTLEYYTETYLINEDGAAYAESLNDLSEDVSRFTKLAVIFEMMQSMGRSWLGIGLGQFTGGSVLGYTEFYKKYDWLLFGTMPYLLSMIIQLGIIGFMVVAWRTLSFVFATIRRNIYPAANMSLLLLSFFIIILFYNDSLNEAVLMVCYLYFMMLSYSQRAEES